MHADTILYITGGMAAFLAALFVAYLVFSHKRGKTYRDILRQETEFFDALTTTSPFTKGKNSASTGDKSAEPIIPDYAKTDLSRTEPSEAIDFNASALEGRYILRSEIHGGGMSRVFLADSAKLGNQWIVKYISSQNGKLANEENILKLLNHASLPKIIDIFRDGKGAYMVESYIEGATLKEVLESGQKISQYVIMEWAEQLGQVLKYLHGLEPIPIHHYDLKPSNVMVTHDNRLVVIDFGISKRFGEDDAPTAGVTYQYAAPEQLKRRIAEKHIAVVKSRFGELPAERMNWNPDARTDIYSLGAILFELAVGHIATLENRGILKTVVSHELCRIIDKCLATDPADRYQSAAELLADLQKAKGSKMKMARTLLMRKLASASCVAAVLASGGSFSGGWYVNAQENAAVLDARPAIVTVSLQQTAELAIEKRMPNGKIVALDNAEISWSHSQDNIARVDGSRISGVNLGETRITGRYRNKTIELEVRVVEPMDGMVEICQRYRAGRYAEVYAGSEERDPVDGALGEAEFTSPEGIAIAGDGTVHVTDAGALRRIRDGRVETIRMEPFYMMPNIIRSRGLETYVATHEWQEDDGYRYAIGRLAGGGLEIARIADAQFTKVEDFAVGADGLLYLVEYNAGVDGVFLKTLDPASGETHTLCELPEGTSSLAMDESGAAYLANPESGAIQIWRNGELAYFAGVENEKAFIDGNAPLFYMPQKLKYADGALYVWDFNVLRRISVNDGAAGECVTVVGEASPTFDLHIAEKRQAAEEIILPSSRLMDFAVMDSGGVLLTDPKRGVIWLVE